MKKYLSYFALAAILAVGFSACGSDDPKPDPDPIVNPDPEPQPEPEPEPQPDPTPTYPKEFYTAQMSIDTEGGAAITSKEDYVNSTISLKSDIDESWNISGVTGGVRGRGNSSWLWYDKKPYRIKFDKKQELMGLKKAKSWVLLAEYRDPTDLMNAFVFEYAQMIGMPYTNHNRFVELTLNGKYIGLYHLTEQVQQNENRVAIDELNGILMQLDRDDGPELAPGAGDNYWSEVYRMPVCIKNPEDLTQDRIDAIKAEFAKAEKAVKDGDYAAVCSLIDIDSMIKFLIIQELVYNVELDAPRSMYMHKDVDGKWFMGPLWDFDAGFDFDWNTMYTGHTFFTDYRELVMGTNPATHAGTGYRIPGFFSDLFKMQDFKDLYKKTWEEVAPKVSEAWTVTEQYYLANKDAFAREASRWPIDALYDTQIPRLKSWLDSRTSYLNKIIANY